jgi:hypothetical protein
LGDDASLFEFVDAHFAEACRDVADRRQGLQHAQRAGASAIGHGFGDQGYSEAEYSAHAKSGEKSVQREVPVALAEKGEAGKDRVHENRDGEHFGPAVAIAQCTEDDAADTPAD